MSHEFFEAKASAGARTWVVHPYQKQSPKAQNVPLMRSPEIRLEEAVSLCDAIWLEVIGSDIVPLQKINASMFIGSGKAASLKELFKEQQIELAVFDCSLSPVQQRELEKVLECKVIDRTALILEIFGERAATKEGILQVELASLQYQKSRLVRSWTHLERQRGGFGFLGGPGESQIESDRRAIEDRMIVIKKQLAKVVNTRALHRKHRDAVPYPVVALVGYTNAGKSTLFNRLTQAGVFAENLLFATLDPTMRQLVLPSGLKLILSDTVGFISDLPTQLVAAFRATLEEVVEADLILHIRDIASPDSTAQKDDVEEVLNGLGLSEKMATGMVEVLNKIDQLESADREKLTQSPGLAISATSGEGVDTLLAAIDQYFTEHQTRLQLTLPASNGKLLAWLHEHGTSVETTYDGADAHISLRLSAKHRAQLAKEFGVQESMP